MNISDIKELGVEVPVSRMDCIKLIFSRQRELHEKYRPIEEKNGIGLSLIKGQPFLYDDPKCQYLVKDFAWRVTEELTEAVEAELECNMIHTIEEVIDALHFYTELLIICGYTADNYLIFCDLNKKSIEGLSEITDWMALMSPAYYLGLACNLLKNKPWKNTHLVTDTQRFRRYLMMGYHCIFKALDTLDVHSIQEVTAFYLKKSLVNKFRMESNY